MKPKPFKLRREGAGFYRSQDLRFSARRWSRTKWVALDKRAPNAKVTVKTLRDCRMWFKFALACDPRIEERAAPRGTP